MRGELLARLHEAGDVVRPALNARKSEGGRHPATAASVCLDDVAPNCSRRPCRVCLADIGAGHSAGGSRCPPARPRSPARRRRRPMPCASIYIPAGGKPPGVNRPLGPEAPPMPARRTRGRRLTVDGRRAGRFSDPDLANFPGLRGTPFMRFLHVGLSRPFGGEPHLVCCLCGASRSTDQQAGRRARRDLRAGPMGDGAGGRPRMRQPHLASMACPSRMTNGSKRSPRRAWHSATFRRAAASLSVGQRWLLRSPANESFSS